MRLCNGINMLGEKHILITKLFTAVGSDLYDNYIGMNFFLPIFVTPYKYRVHNWHKMNT